jgi:hypothetical protein
MKHKRKKDDELLFEIFSRLLLAFFFNFIGSAIPDWSSSIFILNLALISAGIIVSIIFYKKVSDPRTMWNRVGFVLLLLMGFFWVTPFLRIAYGTSLFWILLAAYLIYIFNFILRYLDVFHGVQVSGLSTNRYMMIWVTFLLFIGSFFLTNDNGNIVLQIFDADAPPLLFPIVFYLGGLIMTLVSFTLLVDN